MKEAEDKSLQALQKDWHDVWDGGTYSTHEEALSLRALLDLGTYYSITDRAWWMYVTRIIQKLGKTDRKTTLLKGEAINNKMCAHGRGSFKQGLDPAGNPVEKRWMLRMMSVVDRFAFYVSAVSGDPAFSQEMDFGQTFELC